MKLDIRFAVASLRQVKTGKVAFVRDKVIRICITPGCYGDCVAPACYAVKGSANNTCAALQELLFS